MSNASSPVTREQLLQRFDALLEPQRFKDYGPNGLQVEGKAEVRRLVSGVTASLALIEAAVQAEADAIFVHHGLFWRGQDGRVTGWMKKRLQLLLAHDINLYAYHLPLDAHPSLGNNAQLGMHVGWGAGQPLEEGSLIYHTEVAYQSGEGLVADLREHLRREITAAGDLSRPIKRLAWCTGGAQSYFEQAIDAGVDAFVTGEISEPQAHLARESGVLFLAAGHHATERYGAPAAAALVADELGLEHQFIEVDNPA